MLLDMNKTVMNASAGGHEGGSSKDIEPDRPPVKLLTALLVLMIVGLGVFSVISKQLLVLLMAQQEHEVDLGVESPALREQRIKEQAQLTGYDVADQQKGLYQIPIDQAIDLLVKRQSVDLSGAATK